MRNPLQPQIDRRLFLIARRRPPGPFARSSAKFASPWATVAEGLAAALALRAAGRPAIPAAVAAPAALLIGDAIKRVASRPRPGLARFARKGRQSFPSTHVAGPAALLACAWCLAPRTKAWLALLGLASGWTALIARERVCAGEHWATDVAAGGALGILVGLALGRSGSSGIDLTPAEGATP
jgi:membrane-associated phospholipid phosphatase